jgi:hypothetical protein
MVDAASVDLYWLPLGAGGRFVRFNGRVYERIVACAERRRACALYHAALEIKSDGRTFVIEQAPVRDLAGTDRGVVAEGPVGARWAGRWRLFRYEIRVWSEGSIPDVVEAVESPKRVTSDPDAARRVLRAVPLVPTPTWGRDELRAGEMWNSNAVISWVIERAGIDAGAIALPTGGRAPGWRAGISVARRP